MFSWKCKHCDKSIRSSQQHHQNWMGKAVVVTSGGSVVKGEYDGYGRVGAMDVQDLYNEQFAMYHQACYDFCGKPEYEAPSTSAGDQGWGELEPFTYFPPGYDPNAPGMGYRFGGPDEEETPGPDARETHEHEALSVFKELLPLLPEMEFTEDMTLGDVRAELQKRDDARRALSDLEMKVRKIAWDNNRNYPHEEFNPDSEWIQSLYNGHESAQEAAEKYPDKTEHFFEVFCETFARVVRDTNRRREEQAARELLKEAGR
jgi:hypothetical protein